MRLPKAFLVSATLALIGGLMLSTTALAAPPASDAEGARTGPWGVGAIVRERVAAGFAKVGDVVAQLTGLTQAQLHAEREAGKSLGVIADEAGVSEQEVIDTVLQERRPAIEEVVAAGEVTRAQADFALSRMQARIQDVLQRTAIEPLGEPGGWGRGEDHGGVGRGGRGMTDGSGRIGQRASESTD